MRDPFDTPAPAGLDAREWRTRLELAALYRVFDRLGWTELIYNHITAKIPDTEHLLINAYGLHYSEISASSLVKIDLDGEIVGRADWPVNPAGLVIHTAIHRARPDARCVAHTHTTAGLAVACARQGLRDDNFYSSMLAGKVAYHPFEGVTVRDDERARLVAGLGDKDFLILRSHGLLVCGHSVAAAFANAWLLQRACEVQVATDARGGDNWPISSEISQRSAAAIETMRVGRAHGQLELSAMVRLLDRVDRSWRT